MMRHEQSEQRVFGKPVPWATLAAAVPAVVIAAGGAGFLVRLGFARGFGLSVDDVTASQTTLVATVALEGALALLLAAFSYLAWRIGVQVSAGLQRTRRVTRWLRCRGFVAGMCVIALGGVAVGAYSLDLLTLAWAVRWDG
jgi:hypothetical protein